VFACLSGHGYVGLGEVTAEAVPFKDFTPADQRKPLPELPLVAKLQHERLNDPERWDLCAAVKWIKTVDRDEGVLKNRARLGTVIGRHLAPRRTASSRSSSCACKQRESSLTGCCP
jgi:hypothetical protein